LDITKLGKRPTLQANPECFSGVVWKEKIIEAPAPARVRALKVTFEPKAHTAWHTHPLGQTLYVICGIGLIGLRGQKPKQIAAGDTIWIPPEQEHWHGATPTNSMTHIAIQEAEGAISTTWMEKVNESDYLHPDITPEKAYASIFGSRI